MGNVCDAFWPIAERHMAHAADAQAQELSALTLQNHVEDPAGTLTSLPADLLRKLLGFLTVDDVHERAKPVSKLVRSEARFVLTRGRWKPVKFVAEHGEQLMWAAGRLAQVRDDALTPAQRDWRALWDQPSSLALCKEAWKVDPNETLRLLFDWGHDAARFLALVEPSLDGLERIVRVCEPAHGFVYAKHELDRWWRGTGAPTDDCEPTIEVIMGWAEFMGTPFDESTWKSLPVERRNLVVGYVSKALRSWTDAAVVADFLHSFFCKGYMEEVFDLGDFTRGWDDGKASALAAAYTADVAASRLSAGTPKTPRGNHFMFTLFTEKVHQVEELLQLEPLLRGRARRTPWGESFAARPTYYKEGAGYFFLVEFACSKPGKFY